MSIIRATRPENNYTIISNAVIRDTRLSFRARGVLLSLLSRPSDWRTNADALSRESKEGRTAILTALTELESFGYLVRIRRQDSLGRWTTDSVVYDEPRPKADYPTSVEPTSVQPTSDNPTPLKELIKNEREQQQLELVAVTPELADGKVLEIVNRLDAAREQGLNSWSLTSLVFQAYDQLDAERNSKATIDLVNWYAQELLARPLFVSEISRTATLIRKFGRIGVGALDYACTKSPKDPWAYAFKVAEKEYERAKNGN